MRQLILADGFSIVLNDFGQLTSIIDKELPDAHLHRNVFEPDSSQTLKEISRSQEIEDCEIAGKFIAFVGGAEPGMAAIPIFGDEESCQQAMWALLGYYAAKRGVSLSFINKVQLLASLV